MVSKCAARGRSEKYLCPLSLDSTQLIRYISASGAFNMCAIQPLFFLTLGYNLEQFT